LYTLLCSNPSQLQRILLADPAAVGDTLLTTLLVCLGHKQVRCNSYGSLRALGVWLSQNLFVNSVYQLAHELALELELLDTPD